MESFSKRLKDQLIAEENRKNAVVIFSVVRLMRIILKMALSLQYGRWQNVIIAETYLCVQCLLKVVR